MNTRKAYLQHGVATLGQSCRTESVEIMRDPIDPHEKSGRANKMPSDYKIKYLNRWHRVYFDSQGADFIQSRGDKIPVTITY